MKSDIYAILILFSSFSILNISCYYLIVAIKSKKRIYLPVAGMVFGLCLFFAFFELEEIYLEYPHLMWIAGPLQFALGPLLYLQVKKKVKWFDIFHFWLVPLAYWRLAPFYVLSEGQKIDAIIDYFNPVGAHMHGSRLFLYLLQIGVYSSLGYFSLRKRIVEIKKYESNEKELIKKQKLKSLYLLIGILSAISLIYYFLHGNMEKYGKNALAYTLVSFVFLAIILQIYFTVFGFDRTLKEKKQSSSVKTADNSKQELYKSIVKKLDATISKEKLYRNPDLKLQEVADFQKMSLHDISAAINSQKGMNFFDYINSFRIEELKTTLLANENSNLTLFAIGEKAGFKSNSSFYRVFKKYMGITPKQYIDRYSKKD